MLGRAYSNKYKQIQPTYEGVTVCEEWHFFMRFRAWMMQDCEGKHLDKDILFEGNKVYSPDTCVFVDGVVNTFLNDCQPLRHGLWFVGMNGPKKFQTMLQSVYEGSTLVFLLP